jgi:hypothetical protein
MKKLICILFVAGALSGFAQPGGGKPQKMAPTVVPGYYLGQKGDTIRGEIQNNPENETELYKGFMFKLKGAGKLARIDTKKAKGFGFEGRHFTLVPYDAETSVYIERLVNGRLKFYEYKFPDKKDGKDIIGASYYIQDTGADDKEAELRELKPISTNFYKKDLKPYMHLQPMTWNDLDKFNFVKDKVVSAIKEFNKFYEAQPVGKDEPAED